MHKKKGAVMLKALKTTAISLQMLFHQVVSFKIFFSGFFNLHCGVFFWFFLEGIKGNGGVEGSVILNLH